MNILTSAVPQWVSILFIICIFIPVYFIAKIAKNSGTLAGFDNSKSKKIFLGIFSFFIAYYAYVAIMTHTGLFQENVLPPRIFVFTTIPLLLFYFLFVFKNAIFETILKNTKLSTLVNLHIFRLIGIFFIISWHYGALPKYFAMVAGLGDIFAAVTAIFVAKIIKNGYKNYKTITIIWNVIGLLDIINVMFTGIYLSKLSIETGSKGILEMANFPFALIPAFAPATIIFLHVCVFKKLKQEPNTAA